MEMSEKLEKIQEVLQDQQLDGWLLYDNHGSNRFAWRLLDIPPHLVITRRFFYWIPREGTPVKIMHQIEAESLDFLPGKTKLYLSHHQLEEALFEVLKKAKHIAMEYSPRNGNPYVSVVDAGTFEMIKEAKVKVSSSADLLQPFTSVLSEEQIQQHREAVNVLETTLVRAWDLIADRLRHDKTLTERDVQKFILSEFVAHNCITEDGPTCAVNGHSALPHYMATKESALKISRGDFILIDMWCKKDHPAGVYGDITRVAVAAAEPTPYQQKIFEIVKQAQLATFEFIKESLEERKTLRGSDVDDVCRKVIIDAGYGEQFTHRTGHNIDSEVHGSGVHLDNLETADHRMMLPGMVFSVEPGIYLPGEFGVRLESNILIDHHNAFRLTSKIEESIICLL